MLGKPAFLSAEVRRDTQRKALLAQKHIAAVAGVHGNDGVVLREVADIALLGVDVALAVQTADPVLAVAQRVKDCLAHAGHDRHAHHHIDGVGDLDAVFGKGRTDCAHGIGDDIHGATVIGALRNVVKQRICLVRRHPVVGRAGVFFFFGANEGSALHARHIIRVGAMQIAARQLFFIQLNELAGLARLCAQHLQLCLTAVDPHNLVRLQPIFLLFYPFKDRCVLGHTCLSLPSKTDIFGKPLLSENHLPSNNIIRQIFGISRAK